MLGWQNFSLYDRKNTVIYIMCVDFARDSLAAYFVSLGRNMLVSDG